MEVTGHPPPLLPVPGNCSLTVFPGFSWWHDSQTWGGRQEGFSGDRNTNTEIQITLSSEVLLGTRSDDFIRGECLKRGTGGPDGPDGQGCLGLHADLSFQFSHHWC